MPHFILYAKRHTAQQTDTRPYQKTVNCWIPRIAQCGVTWLSPCVADVPLLVVTNGCQGGWGILDHLTPGPDAMLCNPGCLH